jgi:hypothetical protein
VAGRLIIGRSDRDGAEHPHERAGVLLQNILVDVRGSSGIRQISRVPSGRIGRRRRASRHGPPLRSLLSPGLRYDVGGPSRCALEAVPARVRPAGQPGNDARKGCGWARLFNGFLFQFGDLLHTDLGFAVLRHVVLGKAFMVGGKHDEAIQELETAVEMQGKVPYTEPPYVYYPTRRTLGAAYLLANRPALAAQEFLQTLIENPNDAYAYWGFRKRAA